MKYKFENKELEQIIETDIEEIAESIRQKEGFKEVKAKKEK